MTQDCKYRQIIFVSAHHQTHVIELARIIEFLNKNGLPVSLIDVRIPNNTVSLWDNYLHTVPLHKVTNVINLINIIKRAPTSPKLVIFLTPPTRRLRHIWRIFRKHGYFIGFFALSLTPREKLPNSNLISNIESYLGRVWIVIKSRFKPELDLCIASGEGWRNEYFTFFRNISTTKTVWAHSFDYEYYHFPSANLNIERIDKLCINYILFLDQAFLEHPDRFANGVENQLSKENFKKLIRQFLTALSYHYKQEVIIAQHPKASTESNPVYKGFNVLKNCTHSLIKNASIVVAHSSTAIQYAVTCGKPLLLYTTNDLKRTNLEKISVAYSIELDAQILNLDEAYDFSSFVTSDVLRGEDKKEFFRKYIKKDGSPDIPLRTILLDSFT